MKKTVSILALCGLIVYAQEEVKLDKVFVTATGFEEVIGEQVRNIQVITREEIEGKAYKSIQEVLEHAPSVTFSNSGFGQEIDIRGQGAGAKQKVKVMVDGIGLNGLDNSHGLTPFDTIDVDDIERIEIIPGGGSVLYGSGTKGGVVNIITKRSPKPFYANIITKGGIYEESKNLFGQYGVATGGTIGNLFVGGLVRGFDENGFRKNDKREGFYGSLEGLYSFNDAYSLRLKGSYYFADLKQPGTLSHDQLNADRAQSGRIQDLENTRYDILAEYRGRFAHQQEVSAAAYYRYSNMEYVSGLQNGSHFEDETAGASLKYKLGYGLGNQKGNLILGYDITQQKASTDSIIMGNRSAIIEPQKLTNSFFFVETHQFNELFSLLGGARVSHDNYKVERRRYSSGNVSLSFNDSTSDNNYAIELTPSLHYSKSGKAYLKYERGFISPTPSQKINTNPTTGFTFNDVKSETYNTFEIGMKDYIGPSFIQFSLFSTYSNNMILQEVASGLSQVTYSNLDKARQMGVELSLEQMLEKFSFNESFSYIDATLRNGINKGREIPLVPRYKATFGADYQIMHHLSVFGNVAVYGDAKTTSYTKIDAYALTNIGLKSQFAGLRLDAGVKNLFDTKYNYYQSATTFNPAPGRNYYLEMRYYF